MYKSAPHLSDPLTAAPVLVTLTGLILIEATIVVLALRRGYDTGEAAASVAVGVGNILTRSVNRVLIAFVMSAVSELAPWQWDLTSAWTWVAGFVGVEFCYYWMHRLGHRVWWMWASHGVHHSASHFILPSAMRLSWTGVLSAEWLVFLPLVLIGCPPMVVATLLALNLLYQFFLHTELSPRWGPLEYVLNTPTHHRIHHASNVAYLDKNFGGVLIVFDRLFGTFAREEGSEPLRFGLTTSIDSHNPFVIAFAGWGRLFKAVKNKKGAVPRLRLLFGPPRD